MGSCMAICDKIEGTRKLSFKTGHVPRCIVCGFAYSDDLGQTRCPCCKNSLRRTPR